MKLAVTELGLEIVVEIFDGRDRLHGVFTIAKTANEAALLDIVLIADFSDDLLEDIFDGNKAGDTTVLVYDDRHMVAVLAKLP